MSKKQKLLDFLIAGPRTNYELCLAGFACCYSKRISEWRAKGYVILCERIKTRWDGNSLFLYTLQGRECPECERVYPVGEEARVEAGMKCSICAMGADMYT